MGTSSDHSQLPVYTLLDRGDNELIGTDAAEPVIQTSNNPALNTVPLFDSKPSSGESAKCLSSLKNDGKDESSCCICQVARAQWKSGHDQRNNTSSEENSAKNSAVGGNNDFICRICLEGITINRKTYTPNHCENRKDFEKRGDEGFISPCDCSGTMGLVHRTCLERWLTLLDSSECEICRHKYRVRRYMRRPAQISQLPFEVCGDLVCITVLSPLSVLVVYFTINASLISVREGKAAGAVALIGLATVIVGVYVAWVFCTVKSAIAFWWGSNRIVRLSANQVGPVRSNHRL